MSAEPNLKISHPDSPEFREAEAKRLAHLVAEDARREKHLRQVERSEWLTLWRTYERCVEISELVWKSKLDDASAQQQALAEGMRDRGAAGPSPTVRHGPNGELQLVEERNIPVPLFTPRDRAQFIKEVAATLLISADKQTLRVHFPKEKPTEEQQSNGAGGHMPESEPPSDSTHRQDSVPPGA